MGEGHFAVDLQAMQQAETGVRDAVKELADMAGGGGVGDSLGASGIGAVTDVMDSAPRIGQGMLPAMLIGFANKWEWGVKFLVEDGVAAADALAEVRAEYEASDAAATRALQGVEREKRH